MARPTTRNSRKAIAGEKEDDKAGKRSSPYSSKTTTKSPSKQKTCKTATPSASTRKRKAANITQDSDDEPVSPQAQKTKKLKKERQEQEEKRLKPFRAKAPQTFLTKLERAQTQRMVVISRTRHNRGQDLHEDIDIVGTTGNIYTVTIGRLPSCTCPDHQKGNECKHKVYALHTVLKAPPELQYQRAFLTSEVKEIFAAAPPIPHASKNSDEEYDGKRKPVEGECPICYMDFDPDQNELVWCKAACGNNMHKECFDQWAASQRGQQVRCVYCRTPWQADKTDIDSIVKAGTEGDDGYVNVAEQFGIDRERDWSTYHQPWVRRRGRYRW